MGLNLPLPPVWISSWFSAVSLLQPDCSRDPQVLPRPTGKTGLQSPRRDGPGLVRRHNTLSFARMDTTFRLQASRYITDTENTTHSPGHLKKEMKRDSPPEASTWLFTGSFLSSLLKTIKT